METKFPMDFDKCPNCESPETVEGTAWEEEIAKGRAGEGSKLPVQPVIVPLLDPRKGPGITVTVVIKYYVDCAKCGTRYLKRAETQNSPVQMGPPPGRPPQNIRPFGFPQGPQG